MQYFNWKLLLVLTISFLSAQTRQSTHQIQAKYYKTITTPPTDTVTVLTGLDVLLEKKIALITGKLSPWSPIKLESTAMVYQTINDY